jgi:hypothetical protein
MPEMKDCKMFSAMCASNPSLSYCSSSVNQSPPEMKMYFHTGIVDYVLFESWVPRTIGAYAGTLIAIFVVAFFSKGIDVATSFWEAKWKMAYNETKRQGLMLLQQQGDVPQKQRIIVVENGKSCHPADYNHTHKHDKAEASSENTEMSTRACRTTLFFSQFCWKTAGLRGLLQCLSISLHFFLMLLVMTFNVGFVIVVILGLTLGSVVFTPVSYELETHATSASCH